jgi:hypothetical protein
MTKYLFLCFFFIASITRGQAVIGVTNSGAYSGSNLIFSVGEVYIDPITPTNEVNSGIIGILSLIEFTVTGTDEALYSSDIRAYPNPTHQQLNFEIKEHLPFSKIYIYSINGELVASKNCNTSSVDLSSLPPGTYIIRSENKNIPSFTIIKE